MSAAVNLNFWRRSLCLKLKWWRSCRRSHYVFHITVDIHFFFLKKRRYCFTRKKKPQSIVFKCCLFAFFCLLSVLCFVVNNVFRHKIYLRFWSEIQLAVSDVLSFFPFHLMSLFETGCFFLLTCFIKTSCFNFFVFGWFCCGPQKTWYTRELTICKCHLLNTKSFALSHE